MQQATRPARTWPVRFVIAGIAVAAMVLVAVVIFWWALQVQMSLVKWGIQP